MALKLRQIQLHHQKAVIVKTPHISVLALWLTISPHLAAFIKRCTFQRSGHYWYRRGKYFVLDDWDENYEGKWSE